jgi:hypothetical protein
VRLNVVGDRGRRVNALGLAHYTKRIVIKPVCSAASPGSAVWPQRLRHN